MSFAAENERVNIRQRQAEGIAAAKARGMKFGRPKKYRAEDFVELYKRVKKGEVNKKQAMEIMGACETTYYRVMREVKNLCSVDKKH